MCINSKHNMVHHSGKSQRMNNVRALCRLRYYSETCLLRPLKGLCQVVLIEQVVFIARSSNLTLTSGFFFMIKTIILFYYYKKPM